jgi:hypothetical protein
VFRTGTGCRYVVQALKIGCKRGGRSILLYVMRSSGVGCYSRISFIPSDILGVTMVTSTAARRCCFLLAWHGIQILSREWKMNLVKVAVRDGCELLTENTVVFLDHRGLDQDF